VGNVEFLFFLSTAFGLGAFHALEPGHGKTVITAYLVGSRGTAWEAMLLGLVVAVTHTSSVLILGVLSLLVASRWGDWRLTEIIGVISGALISVIGLRLLVTRCRTARKGSAYDHDHADLHHDHEGSHHHHPELSPGGETAERVGLWSIVVLGISGGIVPCPAALVVLLASLNSGDMTSGLSYLLMFSLGVAAVLVALGLIVSRATRLAGRALERPWLASAASIASAVLITVIGMVMLWRVLVV
jgi:nickel/cobalt exporter